MKLPTRPHEYFMKEAYNQALIAYEENEIPVGAVIVADNRIIARAYNQVERLNDATAHAEMIAITAAEHQLGSKYLVDCSLYVTLEPCIMCAGAISWTQFSRIIFGAKDKQRGYTTYHSKILHSRTEVIEGIMEKECQSLILDFFKRLRN